LLFTGRCLATAAVQWPIWRSLCSSGSTCHSILSLRILFVVAIIGQEVLCNADISMNNSHGKIYTTQNQYTENIVG
jgi:hypothetical protein